MGHPAPANLSRRWLTVSVHLNPLTGVLEGAAVKESRRTIAGLAGYFRDEPARVALNQNRLAYRVQAYEPKPEGERGAVCCATTFLEPGMVGDEYFLTRGHFHANEDCPELEVTVSGTGVLVLMTADRRTWTEPMRAGSVHHVPPGTAHRVANTGDETLVFVSVLAERNRTRLPHDRRTRLRRARSAHRRPADGGARAGLEFNAFMPLSCWHSLRPLRDSRRHRRRRNGRGLSRPRRSPRPRRRHQGPARITRYRPGKTSPVRTGSSGDRCAQSPEHPGGV